MSGFAEDETLFCTSSADGLLEMVYELFIGKVSCLVPTPDQVQTGVWQGVEVINESPESASNPVAHNRIPYLSADRVRHVY